MPAMEFEPLQVSGGQGLKWASFEEAQGLSAEAISAAMAWFVTEIGQPATTLVVNSEDATLASGLVFNYLQYQAFKIRVTDGLPEGAWMMLGAGGGVISGGA